MGCFATQVQSAGQYAFVFETALYALLHDLPDFGQIVPYFWSFAVVYVLPIGMSPVFAPLFYVEQVVQFVDVRAFLSSFSFFGQSSAAHAVDGPGVV